MLELSMMRIATNIEIPKHFCLENGETPVLVTNTNGYGGSMTFPPTPGLSAALSVPAFSPNKAGTGTHSLTFQWTDDNGCTAESSIITEVHAIEAPIAQDSYSDIVDYPPYSTFTATGTGIINWYDQNKILLQTNTNAYTPSKTCEADECTFIYFVQQELPTYGCVSDLIEITYTQTKCPVPTPKVVDQLTCLGQSIPLLSADTATLSDWQFKPAKGTSNLYWYNSNTTNYSSPIHSGLTPLNTEQTVQNTYDYWVRQYSPTYECYSPARKISLEIWETSKPITGETVFSFCEGDTRTVKFSASGTNIQWYSDVDLDTKVATATNIYSPEIGTTSTVFYATQTVKGCESQPVMFNIERHKKPETPETFDNSNCEGSNHWLSADTKPGLTINWLSNYKTELDKHDATLIINESTLTIGENMRYVYSANAYCNSDTATAIYTLAESPKLKLLKADSIMCEGAKVPKFTAKFSPSDITIWVDENNTEIANGESFTPKYIDENDTMHFSVSALNGQCPSRSIELSLRSEASPSPKIIGRDRMCEKTLNEYYAVDTINAFSFYNWSVTGNRNFNTPIIESATEVIYIDWFTPGVDTIFVTETNRAGCSTTDSLIVGIGYPTPTEFNVDTDNGTMEASFRNKSLYELLEDTIPFETDFIWHFNNNNNEPHLQSHNAFMSDTTFRRKYLYGWHTAKLVSSNNFGCKDSVENEFFIDLKHGLYIPDAFNPTHESPRLNTFKVTGYNLASFEMTIYDNWGNIIWYTNSLENGTPNDAWNGMAKGKLLNTDFYIWKIDASFLDGTEWKGEQKTNGKHTKMGNIALIK